MNDYAFDEIDTVIYKKLNRIIDYNRGTIK